MRQGVYQGGESGSSITVQNDMTPSDANPPSVNAVLFAIGSSAPVNDIGMPNTMGYGVGICPAVPAGMSQLSGTRDREHENYGNYIHIASDSVMPWIPVYYVKYGMGTNGLPINVVETRPFSFFSSPEVAAAAGFYIERMFYNGGVLQQGCFVDKYISSNNGGVAASIKNGIPLSSSSLNNGFSTLTGAPPDNYGGAVVAAKTRGANFFCNARYIRVALARLSLAQAWYAEGQHVCAWIDEDGGTSYPKGCNNNALGDVNDPMIIYLGTGYQNAGRTGSATHFARTTHNGQANGVADLNGCMWEIELGMTSNGSNFFALNPSVDIKNLTSGNTLATDAWGAAGIAANYIDLGATFRTLTAANVNKPYGNAAALFNNATSGNDWLCNSLGIPLVSGGTNLFGQDQMQDFRPNEMCMRSGGDWISGATAGVWALQFNESRGSSHAVVGFRAALYL